MFLFLSMFLFSVGLLHFYSAFYSFKAACVFNLFLQLISVKMTVCPLAACLTWKSHKQLQWPAIHQVDVLMHMSFFSPTEYMMQHLSKQQHSNANLIRLYDNVFSCAPLLIINLIHTSISKEYKLISTY